MFRAILALLLILAAPAYCATLHVARDGGGEYTVIQAAVDAAASGDTIIIGPGRYNEGAVLVSPGWTDFVRVVVRQPELTLIGAGQEQTIIGPATPWNLSQGWNVGVELGTYWGNRHVWISGIGFENMAYGVKGAEAPESAVIRDCRFTMNANSVRFAYGGALEVSACRFDLMPRNYYELAALGMQSVQIAGCQFNLATESQWTQRAVHLESTSTATVSGCSFEGGDGGLSIIGVGSASITNCVFNDQISSIMHNPMGVQVASSAMAMSNCVFDRQTNAIFARDHSDIAIAHTQILSASVASLNFVNFNSLTVHDSVLARGLRYAVWQQDPCDVKAFAADLPHLDMTNNDWGTSNADSIASWIRTCQYVVDYVPFVGQPVSVKGTSWGDLKASFR